MRHIVTMMIVISLLYGCSTPPKKEIVVDQIPTLHPSLPEPVVPRKVKFEVVSEGDQSYVRMDLNNYKRLGIYMEDMLRYIRNTNGVVCHYRHDLNEDFCKER